MISTLRCGFHHTCSEMKRSVDTLYTATSKLQHGIEQTILDKIESVRKSITSSVDSTTRAATQSIKLTRKKIFSTLCRVSATFHAVKFHGLYFGMASLYALQSPKTFVVGAALGAITHFSFHALILSVDESHVSTLYKKGYEASIIQAALIATGVGSETMRSIIRLDQGIKETASSTLLSGILFGSMASSLTSTLIEKVKKITL